MPLVPKNPADQITFYTSHVPTWQSDPEAIGLSNSTVAGLSADLLAAQAAFLAAREARNQARAATLAYRTAVRALHARGSGAIATIKAFAQSTDDPNVYSRSHLSAPRRGGPIAAPAAPVNVSATISGNGALTLSWEARASGASTGVFFQVYRRENFAAWTLLASTADTAHVDPAPLAGDSGYAVIAGRGLDRSGMSIPIMVSLPGGNAATTSADTTASHSHESSDATPRIKHSRPRRAA